MFDKCIKCERLGQDCVPNLFELSWPALLNWWKERQKFLGWSNQVLYEKSGVPVGTINRIKAGEDDCKYSTMRMIIHALTGGYNVEFPCQKKLDAEFAHIEELEKQARQLIDLFAGKLILGISDEMASHGNIDRVKFITELVEKHNASC